MTSDVERVAVLTPVAPLFAEPRVASAQISQLVAGKIVELLECRDDWFRVRGPDEYEGWLHRGYLALGGDGSNGASGSGNAGAAIGRAPIALDVDRISLGCVTTRGAGVRRAMPLGAALARDEQLASGDAVDAAHAAERFPAESGAITRSALRYFEGTSYLWGGVTPWGADCSGLVQSTFALHGIQLRRDAWQQAEQGTPGESDPRRARPADLLFFSDRVDAHITHVAISLGGASLVHLALGRGGYAVEDLDDERDPYVAKLLERFVTARRVLEPAVIGA